MVNTKHNGAPQIPRQLLLTLALCKIIIVLNILQSMKLRPTINGLADNLPFVDSIRRDDNATTKLYIMSESVCTFLPYIDRSHRLEVTADPFLSEVIWVVDAKDSVVNGFDKLLSLARKRLSIFHNETDHGWKIYLLDKSDRGVIPFQLLRSEVVPLVGWKRLHYIFRSTQNGRRMRKWTNIDYKQDPQKQFEWQKFGKSRNFISEIGTSVASVQKMSLETRENVAFAIDEYLRNETGKEQNQKAQEQHLPSFSRRNNTDYYLLDDIILAKRHRPMDVRTFWNPSACNTKTGHCTFRNAVSTFVNSSLPSLNFSVDTEVIGFLERQGRQLVHPMYINALLSTKIVVLAQRDLWEDQYRLMETLLGGALALIDPQVYYPECIQDKVNVVVYWSMPDLLEKIQYYIVDHPEERFKIAARGRRLALTKHFRYQQAEAWFLSHPNQTYVNKYGVTRFKGDCY